MIFKAGGSTDTKVLGKIVGRSALLPCFVYTTSYSIDSLLEAFLDAELFTTTE